MAQEQPAGGADALSNDGIVDIMRQKEQKYMSLLEQRIAELERQIGSSATTDTIISKLTKKDTPETDTSSTTAQDGDTASDKTEPSGAVDESKAEAKKEKKTEENEEEKKDGKKDEKKDDETKKKCRVRNVISTWNEQQGRNVDQDVDAPATKKDSTQDIAFTFRTVMETYEKSKTAYSEVEIQSEGLRYLLREVIGEYSGQSFEGTTVYITGPFQPMVHFWDELKKAIEPQEGDDEEKKQARDDLDKLLDSVQSSPELESYFKIRESIINGVITFEFLWTIFRPKTRVIAKPFLNMPQIFEIPYSPYSFGRRRKLSIMCWCYDYNGKFRVKTYYEFDIEYFPGTKQINSLFCFPTKYLGKEDVPEDVLLKTLEKDGRNWDKLCRVEKGSKQMCEYDDIVLLAGGNVSRSLVQDDDENRTLRSSHDDEISDLTYNLPPKEDSNVKTVAVKGKFIVDAGAYLQHGSRNGSYPLGKYTSVDVEDPDENVDNEEEDKWWYILCPPRVLGYSTQQKIWGQFKASSVEKVKPVKPDTAFDLDLQLDRKYKSMIKALVENHTTAYDSNAGRKDMDVIEGKGRGLVILLHGPPGVGKTLTAETIAEATGKPLLVVSVAEIGLNASKAENNLERMFHLAGAWEAILLVDEADVFLESRMSTGDPNRNALVSVLLRVLDYYEGIMILTTNRITSLDIAVQSRIHLAIRYEDLSKDQKKKIFMSFLDKLAGKSKDIMSPANRAGINDWVEDIGSDHKLNGRQIRNMVNSAHALAVSEKWDGSLRKDHFKSVLSITKEFQEQLEGLTRDRRADNEVGR